MPMRKAPAVCTRSKPGPFGDASAKAMRLPPKPSFRLRAFTQPQTVKALSGPSEPSPFAVTKSIARPPCPAMMSPKSTDERLFAGTNAPTGTRLVKMGRPSVCTNEPVPPNDPEFVVPAPVNSENPNSTTAGCANALPPCSCIIAIQKAGAAQWRTPPQKLEHNVFITNFEVNLLHGANRAVRQTM